jgi:HSP20 family protein
MDYKSLIPFGRSSSLARSGETDPFTNMRREMDRMFDDFTRDWPLSLRSGGSAFLSPKVNIAETDKGLELTAELPGIDQKDIELDLSEGVLTLKAEHKIEKEEKDEARRYHLVERSYGTFLRRFALPFEADQDRIEASFDKGVLKVTIPRAPHAEKQGKKIAIKGN